MNDKKEIWKPVRHPLFEESHEYNVYGDIRSKPSSHVMSNGKTRETMGKILTPHLVSKRHYLVLTSKIGDQIYRRTCIVHYLLAGNHYYKHEKSVKRIAKSKANENKEPDNKEYIFRKEVKNVPLSRINELNLT